MPTQQEFSHNRSRQLLSLLIASTNPNINQQQAEVTANTIASTFNVTPRISGVSKKKSKSNPRKNTKTGQYFSIVEQNDTQNQPVSVSLSTASSNYGCNVEFNSGYITLNMTRKQAKALRYALHSFLQQSQQPGQQQNDSSWQKKVSESTQANAAVA